LAATIDIHHRHCYYHSACKLKLSLLFCMTSHNLSSSKDSWSLPVKDHNAKS